MDQKDRPVRVYQEKTGEFYIINNGKKKILKVPAKYKTLKEVQQYVIKKGLKLKIKAPKQKKTRRRRRRVSYRRPSYRTRATRIKPLNNEERELLETLKSEKMQRERAEYDDQQKAAMDLLLQKEAEIKEMSQKLLEDVKRDKIDQKDEEDPDKAALERINETQERIDYGQAVDEFNEMMDHIEVLERKINSGEPENIVQRGSSIVKDYSGTKKSTALWSNEIDEFFQHDDNYLGTIASDQIDELELDTLPAYFVMNTDTSDMPGSHWVAIYISPDSVEYYDSSGSEPDFHVVKQLKDLIKRANLPNLLKFKVNKVAAQKNSSNNCGYFAIRFLDERRNGAPFIDATRFDTNIVNQKGLGEKTISEEFRLI